MAPKSRKPSRREQSVSVPTEWSEWTYSEEHKCDIAYRLDSRGQYEYDYRPTNGTSTPRVSSISSQTPQTTSDTQWGYADFSVSTKRGRSTEYEESITPRRRGPSISPTRPIKPPPNPAPQPPPNQPEPEPEPQPEQTRMMPTAYNNADDYGVPLGALSISSTETAGQSSYTTSSTSNTQSNQYIGSTGNGGQYSSEETSWSGQNIDNTPRPFQVTIRGDKRKERVTPTKGTTQECFISADFAERLGGKRTKSKAQYYDESSKRTYYATERMSVDINPREENVRGVYLYIVTSKSFGHSVILTPQIISRLQSTRAPDSVSSTSEDSGYGTGNGNQRPQQSYPVQNMNATVAGADYSTAYPSQSNVSSPPAYSSVPRYPVSTLNQAAYTTSAYPSGQNAAPPNPSSGTGFDDPSKGNDHYGLHSRTS